MTRIGTIVVLADGSKGIRVAGIAVAGDRVSTPKGTQTGPVTRVIWSGRAKDGQLASMVEVGEMTDTRRAGPGRAGTDAYDNH